MDRAHARSNGGGSDILHRWSIPCWTATLMVATAAGSAWAQPIDLPPTPQLANWRGPRNNCYNYAINKKDNDFKQPGGLPWPNVGANLTAPQWCAKVQARAVADGLVAIPWVPGQAIPAAPAGFNLVALGGLAGVKGGGGDYHWWRLNGDGSWSHKRGPTPAKTTYTDNLGVERPLNDPRQAAQTDGYTICGFLGVPKPPAGAQPGAGLVPPPGGVRTWDLRKHGYEDIPTDYAGVQVGQLQSHLPTISAGNQVPDPQWVEPQAPAHRGFSIMPGSGVTGFPPYMRLFRGVVAVYSDLDGEQILYYRDNMGLATFLVGGNCYANCDRSTALPCLNVNDFSCFLNAYAAGSIYSNCDNSTLVPVLNVIDFSCFLNRFAAGCSSCL